MSGLSNILGTDVGGTFTDLALVTGSGELHCFKVPSIPSRPGASILNGVDEIQAALQLEGPAWHRMVHTHSSTVATNALIERKGARVGLLVSAGFRDLFELQRLAVPHPMRFEFQAADALGATCAGARNRRAAGCRRTGDRAARYRRGGACSRRTSVRRGRDRNRRIPAQLP